MTRKSKFIGIASLAAVCVAAVCALSACGGGTKTIDYTKYTESQWLAEDWDSKNISYQFTGNYSQDDGSGNDMSYECMLNLYEDSGTYAVVLSGSNEFDFMGYWSEAEDEDGNVITISIEYGTDLDTETMAPSTTTLVPYAPTTGYSRGYYELYEGNSGTYTLNFYFWMAPGQYYRACKMKGSSEVTYATTDDFRAAKGGSSTGDDSTATFTAVSGDINLTGDFEFQGITCTGYLALNYDKTWSFNDTLTSGAQTLSGTYTYSNDILTLSEQDGTSTYTAEAVTGSEGSYSITIPVISSMGANCTITYSADDIVLPAVTLTASFDVSGAGTLSASLYLFSDSTWKLANSLYGRSGTYTVSSNVITLSEDGSTYATAVEASGSYTLDVSILSAIGASVTFTYTADQISAITSNTTD